MNLEGIIAEILENRYQAILEKDYKLLRNFCEEKYGKVSEKSLNIVVQRAGSILLKQINFLKTGKESLNSNSAEIDFAKRFLLPRAEERERINKMFEGTALFPLIVISEIINLLPRKLLISHPYKAFEIMVNLIGSFYEDLWLSSIISLRNDQEMLERKISLMLKSQDKEKEKLARRLYDELVEPLSSQIVTLEHLFKEDYINLNDRNKFSTAVETLKVILTSVRNFSHYHAFEFREEGIISTIHSYIRQFKEQTNIEVNLISDNYLPQLDTVVRANLFRIFDEVFRNIKRHSGANNAIVKLHIKNSRLFILISDNGRGFDVEKEVFTSQEYTIFNKCGIISMQYRTKMIGGTFKISSKINMGTTVQIELPMKKENNSIKFDRKEIILVSNDTSFLEKSHYFNKANSEFYINEIISFEKFYKLQKFNKIPAILILDISHSCLLTVFDKCYNLKDRFPNLKLLILADNEKEGNEFLYDSNLLVNALVLKDSFLLNPEEIIKTINSGKVLIDENIWSFMYNRNKQSSKINIKEKLSQRELEVLVLVAKGHTNTKIAKELFVSVSTVKNLLAAIYRKLGCSNRAEAASKMSSGNINLTSNYSV